MFIFKLLFLNPVLLLLIFHECCCQRRIQEGAVVNQGKEYVVYFLKAAVSRQYYDGWLCGGALVTDEFIITSAACVTDVIHLYAIAGYDKYISDEQIHNDPCTKEKKKKVVFICTPKAYELVYEQLEKWSLIDIAVVKVESPYNLNDNTFATVCSYTPKPIQINYEMKYQEPGVDAVVFGWGHLAKWRQIGDTGNYNQGTLNYAPTLIQDKESCKKGYEVYTGMAEIIDGYMICTFEKGNINDLGETIIKSPPTAQGCAPQQKRLRGYDGGASCENANNKDKDEIVLLENSRKHEIVNTTFSAEKRNISLNDNIYRNVVDSNITKNNESLIQKLYRNYMNSNRSSNTRRSGICQNDHGGPLVTWVGSHEVLIGVASVFKIADDFSCEGPYLYTSTQCNGAFIDCILSNDPKKNERMRRAICDAPPSVKGFELIEKHISWKDHPDGPADNEKDNHNATKVPSSSTTVKIETEKLKQENQNFTTNLVNTTFVNPTTADSIKHLINNTIANTINTTNISGTTNTSEINNSNVINNTSSNSVNTSTVNTTNVISTTETYLIKNTIKATNTTLTENIINSTQYPDTPEIITKNQTEITSTAKITTVIQSMNTANITSLTDATTTIFNETLITISSEPTTTILLHTSTTNLENNFVTIATNTATSNSADTTTTVTNFTNDTNIMTSTTTVNPINSIPEMRAIDQTDVTNASITTASTVAKLTDTIPTNYNYTLTKPFTILTETSTISLPTPSLDNTIVTLLTGTETTNLMNTTDTSTTQQVTISL